MDEVMQLRRQLDDANAEIERLRTIVRQQTSHADRGYRQACVEFREELAAMTKARDKACELLESVWSRLYTKREMFEVGDGGVAELLAVGSK